MMTNNEIYASDLLEMKLADVSDLFLERLSNSGKNCIKVDLPGHNVKDKEQFVLRVCLCKGDGLNGE